MHAVDTVAGNKRGEDTDLKLKGDDREVKTVKSKARRRGKWAERGDSTLIPSYVFGPNPSFLYWGDLSFYMLKWNWCIAQTSFWLFAGGNTILFMNKDTQNGKWHVRPLVESCFSNEISRTNKSYKRKTHIAKLAVSKSPEPIVMFY